MIAKRVRLHFEHGALLGLALCTIDCAISVQETSINPATLAGLQCIAVLPFANDTRDYRAGDLVAEMLASDLLVSGRYNIVEPTEVRLILDAQGIAYRPPANLEAARAYGEAVGAQAVFGGDVRAYGRDSGAAPISLESSLVDVRSGEVVWRGSVVHDDDRFSLQSQPIVAMASESVAKLVGNLVYERGNVAATRNVCAKRPSLLQLARATPTPAPPTTGQVASDIPALPVVGAEPVAPLGPEEPVVPGLPDLGSEAVAPDLPSLPDAGGEEPGGAEVPAEVPGTDAGTEAETRAYRFAAEESAPRPELKLSGAQRRLLSRLYSGTAQNHRIFRPNSTALTPNASKLVNDVARILRAVPELRLTFEVHVDLPGPAERSSTLAAKQLEVLRALVTKRAGFAGDRIHFFSVGNREPLAKDKTPRARVQNSRVGVRRVQ